MLTQGLFINRQRFSNGAPGALDLLSVPAAAAFSLRKLRRDHDGPCVSVLRLSDALEADIGFKLYPPELEPRLDEDALLLHAGENLFVQSGAMPTGWNLNGVTVSAASTGPSNQPAFFLQETATPANHYISQARTYIAGAQHVFSYDVQDNGRGFAHFLFNAQVSGFAANIDLATGATNIVAGAGTGTISATSLGDGWWRVDLGITVGAGGLASAFVGGASSLSMLRNGSYLGEVGKGIWVSRPQIVSGTVPKGYARSAASVLDGNGFVSRWYDQSGNGRHATQTTAAAQPRIVNAGLVEAMGARPAIRFVRSNNTVLNAPAFTLAPNRQFMVATVFQQVVAASYARVWVAGSNNFAQGFLGTSANGNLVLSIAGGSSTSAPLSSIVPTQTSPIVVSQVFGTAGQGADVNAVRVNGGTNAVLSEQTGALSTGGYSIGNNGTTNVEGLDGYLPEVIFVAGAATANDRATLEQSQAAYYSIP